MKDVVRVPMVGGEVSDEGCDLVRGAFHFLAFVKYNSMESKLSVDIGMLAQAVVGCEYDVMALDDVHVIQFHFHAIAVIVFVCNKLKRGGFVRCMASTSSMFKNYYISIDLLWLLFLKSPIGHKPRVTSLRRYFFSSLSSLIFAS